MRRRKAPKTMHRLFKGRGWVNSVGYTSGIIILKDRISIKFVPITQNHVAAAAAAAASNSYYY